MTMTKEEARKIIWEALDYWETGLSNREISALNKIDPKGHWEWGR